MEVKELRNCLAMISAVYQNYQVNDFTVAVWNEILRGVTYTEAKNAVVEFLHSSSQFAPTPGQIFTLALNNRAEARRNQQTLAIDASVKEHSNARRRGAAKPTKAADLLSPEQLQKLLKLKGAK